MHNYFSHYTIIKKKSRDSRYGNATIFFVRNVVSDYSPGAIASLGQDSAQVPQSMQVSASIA